MQLKKLNKLMNKNGRLLIRKSGTEPKIRIMGESHDKKLILKCIKIIKKSINKLKTKVKSINYCWLRLFWRSWNTSRH